MPGESGKAGRVLNDAFPKKSGESVLIQSKTLKASDSQFKDSVADVTQRLHRVEGVTDIKADQVLEGRPLGARGVQPQGRPGGHEQDGGEHARRRQRSRQAHPALRIDEAGDSSLTKAEKEQSNEQAGRSLMLTLGLRC